MVGNGQQDAELMHLLITEFLIQSNKARDLIQMGFTLRNSYQSFLTYLAMMYMNLGNQTRAI